MAPIQVAIYPTFESSLKNNTLIMRTRSIIIVAFILLGSFVANSQTVASLGAGSNFASYNTMLVSQLTYDVVDADTNVLIESIDYSATAQNLSLATAEDVQFISIYKDGEVYLSNMPMMSSSLNFSMQNYEAGDYELHLTVMGSVIPTIIEITKN